MAPCARRLPVLAGACLNVLLWYDENSSDTVALFVMLLAVSQAFGTHFHAAMLVWSAGADSHGCHWDNPFCCL